MTEQNIERSVGQRIRLFRERKGMTQKQLGEAAGILEATIRKYEIGQRNPKPDQIAKIADALDITPTALAGFNIKSDADVIAMVLALDDLGLINFQGEADDRGGVTYDSLAIRFVNKNINVRLSAWTAIRENLAEKKKDRSKVGREEYEGRLLAAQEVKAALMDCKIIIR